MDSPHLQLKRAAREIDARLSNGQPITREAHKALIDALARDGGRNSDDIAPFALNIALEPGSDPIRPIVVEAHGTLQPAAEYR